MKPKSSIAAIVLAAGQSRRMGSPKMLLAWEGTTLLGKVVSTLSGAGVDQILVVTGGARQAVEAEVARLGTQYPVRAAYNEDFAAGEMLSSLQCGLRALPTDCAAALVALGDQPQMEARTVRAVVAGFEATGASLVVPSFENRRGHPWLVAAPMWSALLGVRPPRTARDFLVEHAGRIHYVDAGTRTILQDVDTPEDHRRGQT